MNRKVRYTLLASLLALTLTACDGATQPTLPTPTTGSAVPTNTVSSAGEPTVFSDASPTTGTSNSGGVDRRGNGNATIIEVVVTGGPHAGTYERRSSSATCSANLTGDGSWGNQYSDPEIKDSLSSLQLIVDDTEDASDGTSEFLTTFTFGDFLSEQAKLYEYNGRGSVSSGQKPGNVKIEGSGQNAKVTISIEPEAGVKIDATIQCNEVVRGVVAEPTGTAGPQDVNATINLTLAGSKPSGTFQLTSTAQEGLCGYGAGAGSILTEGIEDPSDAFVVEYYKEGEELTKFWLLVPKTKGASIGSGTSNFYLEVNEDQEYYIDSLEGGDGQAGTVKIQNNGNTATVNVDAKTNDGKTVKATIECKKVTR